MKGGWSAATHRITVSFNKSAATRRITVSFNRSAATHKITVSFKRKTEALPHTKSDLKK